MKRLNIEIMQLSESVPEDTIPLIFAGEQEGAIPNRTVIVKSWGEPNDATPVGTTGVVISSLLAPILDPLPPGMPSQPTFLYFVVWETAPGLPVAVTDHKIAVPE